MASEDASLVAREDVVASTPRFTRRRALGICVILSVVLIWVSSSNLMQFIFKNQKFNKPFFLTYFSTSLFSLYLLGFVVGKDWIKPGERGYQIAWRRISCKNNAVPFHRLDSQASDMEATNPPDSATPTEPNTQTHTKRDTRTLEHMDQSDVDYVSAEEYHGTESASSSTPSAPAIPLKMTKLQVLRTSLIFCPVWFLANYSFNISLTLTSVASNTILSTTSGLFTLIFSALVREDRFTVPKLAAVLLSLGGVAMVSVNDSDSGESHSEKQDSLIGDALSLLSAVFYATYSVLMKKLIRDERRLHMTMFFGFVGMLNSLMLWPIAILLNYLGIEPFEWPPGMVLLYLFINGLIGTVLSDYLWLWSVLLTSPVITTIGLTLSIPLAMLSDVVFRGKSFGVLYVFGSFFVVSGFILINLDLQKYWVACRTRMLQAILNCCKACCSNKK